MNRQQFDEDHYEVTSYRADTDTLAWYITCDSLYVGDYGGAGSIGEANIRALEDTEGAFIQHHPYSTRTLWLPDNKENQEIIRRIEEEYPIIDEEMLSKVEQEWFDNWFQDSSYDIRHELKDIGKESLADHYEDLIGSGTRYNLLCEAMETANIYPHYEYNSAYVQVEQCINELAALLEQEMNDKVMELQSTYPEGMFNLDIEMDRKILSDWLKDSGKIEYLPILAYVNDRQEEIASNQQTESSAD